MTAKEPRRGYRPGLPELVALFAVLGIAWWLRPHWSAAPDAAWQCDHPEAPLDCFVQLPKGALWMGAQSADPDAVGYDPDASDNEGPPHEVFLSTFWMMRTEASVGTYRQCVKAGACSEDEVAMSGGFSTYYPADGTEDPHGDLMPVNSVTWKGADAMCRWLGGRLPTEAEWEYAARGSEGRRWPWGSVPNCPLPPGDDSFWRLRDQLPETCAQDGPTRVINLPNPTPEGLIGLAGNLWEWTSDWYAPDAYATAARWDPAGPAAGTTRAQRGGSWTATSPQEVRAAVRGGLDPDAKLNDVGFRCAFGGAQP